MKYLKFVFENDEIRSLTESNESAISSIVNENMSKLVLTNFTYVIENLDKFLSDTNDLAESYDNIKSFASMDVIALINAISEVASIDESFDAIDSIMSENVSSVFTGIGYGTQKATRLITATYA